MMKIGITGGIGSGKSSVCSIFEHLGVPVFYADIESKRMLDEDDEVRFAVIQLLGAEAYQGVIANRKFIADCVFSNPEMLKKLNAVLHPAVFRRFDEWVLRQQAPYVIKEAAILFESGADRGIDKAVHVTAPMELRVKRVMERDGVSREDVEKRMSRQWTDEQRDARSHYRLNNDEQSLLLPQVIALHKHFLESR